ncbi:MAG: CsgG/HfaB family protein, partial [Candidatus Firestonebacteria bacterium]
MKKHLFLCLLFLFFLLSSTAFAEKYIFKDGTLINGRLVNETTTQYTVKTDIFGEVTFLKELVKEVVKETPEGKEEVKDLPKVYGKPVKLSVMDFELQSSNPMYAYFGKGFAEFISVEISKSRDISLVEREKRREIIEEQKFTLTGLVDEKNSIEIGKMLAANYLITGKIIDITGKIVITYRVMDTETGLVIFDGKIEEDPGKYDYIAAFIARAILVNFSAKVPADTELKVAKAQSKSVEVAVNFSQAVDSYDKKDYNSAKKDLVEAKKLDPTNDAVKYYINKLFKNTTKFKVMP